MALASNSVLLAIAFVEGSAALILLVIYALLASTYPARYFRYWLTGWAFFFALEVSKIVHLLRGAAGGVLIGYSWSVVMAAFFFAAALDYAGHAKRWKYYASWGLIAYCTVLALELAKLTVYSQWGESLLESVLLAGAGWILLTARSVHRGLGWQLLAGGLVLAGFHGLDRPYWAHQTLGVFRISLQGTFFLASGIAMAVLVLEAGRARNEDLNEKLRRLSLITAQATQSLRVENALDGILRNLVESLGASHGLILLRGDSRDALSLDLLASFGLSETYRSKYAHVRSSEKWVQEAFQREEGLFFGSVAENPILQGCFAQEAVAAGIAVRVAGKEVSQGFVAIGFAVPRRIEPDERHFLVNVANLVGLAVQNIALLESAADSRRQWRDTFDSIDDLILVHSSDGEILRTNRAFADRVKLEPVAIVGKQVRDVLRRGTAQWVRCPYCEGVAGKAEEVDPSFGGYFLVSNSALHGSEGGRLGTIHVLKDFAGRRLAENKFRNLFERAQEGVFIVTPDGKLLDCNSALVRLYGYESKDELLHVYTPAKFYLDIADRSRLEVLLDEFGQVADFEFQFRRRDGDIRTARLSAFVTRDEAGSPIVYQGFLLDITERKQAEVEIRRRNEELLALNSIGEFLRQSTRMGEGLSAVLRNVIDLFSLDVGAVYLWDDATASLRPSVAVGFWADKFERSSSVEVPTALFDQLRLIHPTLLPGSAPTLPEEFRILQQQERILTCQLIILWSQDRLMGMILVGSRHVRAFSAGEMNLLAAVGNQVATSIDKSLLLEQTREAYERLRLAQEQLLQSEKMAAVGQLISGVAHELNNPLTAILGYSQLLQSQEFPENRRGDYIDKLYKQARRTHHIVQSLLSFARQHKPERVAVEINKIVDDTLILREYDMKVANILVHREFDPNLPATAGDFHQLQQVFLNILNNAIDAVVEKKESQPEIWIRTRRALDTISIEFTNNGPPVQNAHRIFDPFYTTKAVGKGTGLGLSICYGIVKEHSGEIQVRNTPRGVTFSVTLPLISAAILTSAKRKGLSSEGVGSRILLLEGEEVVLNLEQEILRKHGLTVRTARAGDDVIEILKHESFDAAIMDVNLPGETSTSFLYSWIERSRPELAHRVVFTASSKYDPQAIDLPSRCGCPLLTKPFSVDDLLHALQQVLASEIPSAYKQYQE